MPKSLDSFAPCACCDRPLTEEEMVTRCHEIVQEYKDKPGGLIPALQMAQSLFGYLPKPVVKAIADGFGKSYSEVSGVVSFYSFFSTRPRGKFLIRVCLGTACYVRGGKDVLEALKKKLGVEVGETTPDRNFTLDVGRCFGACGMAPVVMINDTVHQRVKPGRIGELLTRVLTGENPTAERERA